MPISTSAIYLTGSAQASVIMSSNGLRHRCRARNRLQWSRSSLATTKTGPPRPPTSSIRSFPRSAATCAPAHRTPSSSNRALNTKRFLQEHERTATWTLPTSRCLRHPRGHPSSERDAGRLPWRAHHKTMAFQTRSKRSICSCRKTVAQTVTLIGLTWPRARNQQRPQHTRTLPTSWPPRRQVNSRPLACSRQHPALRRTPTTGYLAQVRAGTINKLCISKWWNRSSNK